MCRKAHNPTRIFVVEDDADTARFIQRALDKGRHQVVVFDRPDDALAALEDSSCSLLLTDVRLPAMTGLELLQRARRARPELPVVLMTAFATVNDTVVALRNEADDFLLKPLTFARLTSTIDEVLARRESIRNRVLAIGAHPDDVEIGIGATLADHVDKCESVTVLTLTHGESGGPALARAAEAERAADMLGVDLVLGDLRDTTVPVNGQTVELIETLVRQVDPTIVYTHSIHDVHQDHRATHQASLVACRGVPQVFGYQSPSATVSFAPRRFVSVDATIDRKLAAIAAYRSQTSTRSYLADDLLRATARYWGRFVESHYAEPLEVVREQVHIAADVRADHTAETLEEESDVFAVA